jgi:hypothetical protein
MALQYGRLLLVARFREVLILVAKLIIAITLIFLLTVLTLALIGAVR